MFNKRLTTVILTGVLAVLLFAKVSVGSESSTVLSEQYRDVVQVLDEAYEGHSEAQLALAYRYLSGDGVEQNDEKAAEWFETAASAGSPEAQTQLGLMYFSGSGVQVSQAEAVTWIGLAAAQDYDPALDLLHWMSQAAH
ncbi:Sel1 repeat-containing protein [Vibrio crassostreae]|uniref:Sel1 repeat-containing protein n=1 Tax=Vibrio crassostreae TaxID=246167 RepID=A0A822MT36_9VIBR|nr:tetratricopeptide repeat protein [Vibrio crassostreae]MDH5949149.1 sel1 repeat family protein [Vibrio crassostreae]TCN11516.1 Sel1 repeat-containing protein [Vibrio crassostreae]TCT76702.1 Sel1 repeat-containing protein [Vibrio crassostreae]TCU10992.1 Sel1 repeat-containing protein [Vibrio crassostreae]CAK1815818.1 Sel1 repeat-containing protein [Vibrio crassostreae]